MRSTQWMRAALLVAAVVCFLNGPAPAGAAGKELLVFAAASTTDAINEIGALYQKNGKGAIKGVYASSSTMAKQIEQGAPADVFISANIKWMDHLDGKKMIAANTRVNLLRNRIALIVPLSGPPSSKVTKVDIREGMDLASLLGKEGRLAVGDPAHVPVGTYAKGALEKLGLWNSVKDRLAPAKDVRAGLALVERAEAPLGIVYESDAAVTSKVRVVGLFPVSSHEEIVYPAGAVAAGDVARAKDFIAFLSSPEAKAIFKKFGFEGI